VNRPRKIQVEMTTLLDGACEALNRLETQVTDRRLAQDVRLDVDEVLYDLFRRIGSETQVALAQAICEKRLGLAELPERLNLSREQVDEGVRELLRRRVIEVSRR
jgi:hypothetical protein